jgi:hypothetical protein
MANRIPTGKSGRERIEVAFRTARYLFHSEHEEDRVAMFPEWRNALPGKRGPAC